MSNTPSASTLLAAPEPGSEAVGMMGDDKDGAEDEKANDDLVVAAAKAAAR